MSFLNFQPKTFSCRPSFGALCLPKGENVTEMKTKPKNQLQNWIRVLPGLLKRSTTLYTAANSRRQFEFVAPKKCVKSVFEKVNTCCLNCLPHEDTLVTLPKSLPHFQPETCHNYVKIFSKKNPIQNTCQIFKITKSKTVKSHSRHDSLTLG